MTPWMKRALLGAMGAAVALAALTACSHSPHASTPEARAERAEHIRSKVVERVAKRLELAPAQRQKLDALADRVDAQRTAFAGNGGDTRARVQALVAGEKFDRAQAQVLWDEKARVIQTTSPDVLAALADFYDSLDATQQQKVREVLEHRKRWLSPI